MSSRESWRLKFDRAQEHFRDFKRGVQAYSESHPYKAVRGSPPEDHKDIWLYRLQITEQPDPHIGLIAGDLVHNLRSALDHLAVAITGRRDAAFPIHHEDPWELDQSGQLISSREKARAAFTAAIDGAPDEAITVIQELQPFAAGSEWATHPLGLVGRLDNADKHRELIPTTTGVTDGLSYVVRRSAVIFTFFWPQCNDGSEVAKFSWNPADVPPESEVHVHVRGTPRVTVEVREINGYVELAQAFTHILDGFGEVFDTLERFVPARG